MKETNFPILIRWLTIWAWREKPLSRIGDDSNRYATAWNPSRLLRSQRTDTANDPREQVQKNRTLVDSELVDHFLETSKVFGRHVT